MAQHPTLKQAAVGALLLLLLVTATSFAGDTGWGTGTVTPKGTDIEVSREAQRQLPGTIVGWLDAAWQQAGQTLPTMARLPRTPIAS